MTGFRFRFLGCGLLATAGAGLLSLTSTLHAGFAFADAANPANPTLVYGGSGLPIAPPDFVDAVTQRFVTPILPGFTTAGAQPAFTPEGF